MSAEFEPIPQEVIDLLNHLDACELCSGRAFRNDPDGEEWP